MTLRPYQVEAIERARDAYRHGARRVVLVSPTGSGKTRMGSAIVSDAIAKGRRVLWLAHRRELVEQAADAISLPTGILMAGVEPSAAKVQVASVQTIAARELRPRADLIVVDECHHATAEQHRSILDAYPGAWVLGLTATPERSDGAALGDVFEALVTGPSVADLVELGHLVPSEVIAPSASHRTLSEHPHMAWRKLAGDRQGFAFTRTVRESRQLAMLIPGAAHVDGTTPIDERARIVDGFRAGDVRVLCSVYVFTEGVDLPAAAVCLLARGCGHPSTYLQMVGRVLRPSPGKDVATIIDLKGVVHDHGMPDDAREYSLEGRAIRRAEALPPVKQCPRCGGVFKPVAECPRCGFVFPPPEPERVVSRDLGRRRVLRPHASADEKRKKLDELRATARARGYKHGWVFCRFKAIYGHGP